MITYVLIVITSWTSFTAPFETKGACEEARAVILADAKATWVSKDPRAWCFKRG